MSEDLFQQDPIVTLRTFRDPDGFCFPCGERIIRVVHPHAADHVRALVGSRLVGQLIAERKMPPTRVLARQEIECASREESWPPKLSGDSESLILEHQRVRFISYPHEWCPEMFYAAGELTLEIQLRAVADGLTLKDATPLNILFEGARPVFVDFLSLIPFPRGIAVWSAYAQFVRTFLLPLLRYRKSGAPPHDLFLGRRDGLEPEELYRESSRLSRLSPLTLQYASLPTWLGRSRKAAEISPQRTKRYGEEQAQGISQMLVRRLRRAFRKVRPRPSRGSAWSGYVDSHSYQSEAFAAKERFVKEALVALAPRLVLDVGCNTGNFSRTAASLGASVVALDSDSTVVGSLFNRVQQEDLPVLPLVMNLARPSPGIGWDNQEAASFLSRAEGRFDVALLLAVVHHLTVTDGIPLSEVFRMLARLVKKGMIVEFVPPEDSMFRRIIRNKEHLIPRLGQAQFEAAFGLWFAEQCRLALPQSGRVLYRLVKRSNGHLRQGSAHDVI